MPDYIGNRPPTKAVDITYDGSTNLVATNIEAALDELDVEKSSTAHLHTATYEPKDPTILKDADIGGSLQAFDADTTKNDIANTFTNIITHDRASGSVLTSKDNTTTTHTIKDLYTSAGTIYNLRPYPNGISSNGSEFGFDFNNVKWFFDVSPLVAGNPVLDDGDLGVTVQAYDVDTAKLDVSQTFSAPQTINNTLTIDDLNGTARPAGFNVAAIDTHNAAYTLVLADAGKMLYHNEATARAWTIPPNSSVAFPIGTVINFLNQSTGDITVTRGSGVALYFFEGDGATAPDANRTLAGSGVATITKISSDGWAIWGIGLT